MNTDGEGAPALDIYTALMVEVHLKVTKFS
jgi:hypothetical protein